MMPRRSFYLGLALIAGGTLMLEIVLTRIFSVIMWYHMSLVAVSMAMFGMTLGALIVHWRPESFSAEKAPAACARHAAWFGASVLVSLLVCINTPFRVDASVGGMSLNSVFLVLYWNAVAALPFVFSGICVTVALTRFPSVVGKLYAIDLAGAATACLAVVWLLNRVDALSAIMLVGALALFAATAFQPVRRRAVVSGAFGAAVVVLALLNAQSHTVRVQYAAETYVAGETMRHDVWNAFSYIRVTEPKPGRFMHGGGDNAGLAPPIPPPKTDTFLYLTMDTRASTPIVHFEGRNWDDVEWLRWDSTSVVHALRDDGPALVIGVGGGRDVVCALLPTRGQRKVVGVEINPITLSLLTDHERTFTGDLASLPNVRLYNDEARSWVARSTERFQVITIPLVDTSAASAAGAFALTENSLYTLEAFELFYDHLTDDGILSISRWWNAGNIGETHRLTAMAAAALRRKGVSEPRKHLVIARGSGLATMLLSKRPLDADDLRRLDDACAKYGFEQLLSPTRGEANVIASVEDPSWPSRPELSYVTVAPATDDQPFFFHSYRMTNLLRLTNAPAGVAQYDRDAMVILLALVGFVTLLAIGVVVVPFRLEQKRSGIALRREHGFTIGFFAMIGFGFMLFESAQLQRLSIFLGYPIYALTVVLFGLLLSSSLGAFIAGNLYDKRGPRAVRIASAGLLFAILAIGIVTMPIVRAFDGATAPTRIAVAAALVAPAGLCMGMLFPMGLRIVARIPGVSLPWCWAVNGMASTCAAVYGIALAISYGFTAAYWTGGACYVLAVVLGLRLTGFVESDDGSTEAISPPAAASAG